MFIQRMNDVLAFLYHGCVNGQPVMPGADANPDQRNTAHNIAPPRLFPGGKFVLLLSTEGRSLFRPRHTERESLYITYPAARVVLPLHRKAPPLQSSPVPAVPSLVNGWGGPGGASFLPPVAPPASLPSVSARTTTREFGEITESKERGVDDTTATAAA